jgi:methionyl-tRNA formyltransferase
VSLNFIFKQVNPELTIALIETIEELNGINDDFLARSRLIGFLTDVIVPERILDLVQHGCYNFHPSLPNRPGWAPLNYALLDHDEVFGITLHRMAPKVDAGYIVAIKKFAVDPCDGYIKVNEQVFLDLFSLLKEQRLALIFNRGPLIPIPLSWGSLRKTKSDLSNDTLVHLNQVSKERLNSLVRAFGYSPELCLLRLKDSKGEKLYFYDHMQQGPAYRADLEAFGHYFFELRPQSIPRVAQTHFV